MNNRQLRKKQIEREIKQIQSELLVIQKKLLDSAKRRNFEKSHEFNIIFGYLARQLTKRAKQIERIQAKENQA